MHPGAGQALSRSAPSPAKSSTAAAEIAPSASRNGSSTARRTTARNSGPGASSRQSAADPSYGAPVTLGESADRLMSGPLGARIDFRF
ncbi:methyltransferase type 11, partial [Streptomyces anulatus]